MSPTFVVFAALSQLLMLAVNVTHTPDFSNLPRNSRFNFTMPLVPLTSFQGHFKVDCGQHLVFESPNLLSNMYVSTCLGTADRLTKKRLDQLEEDAILRCQNIRELLNMAGKAGPLYA